MAGCVLLNAFGEEQTCDELVANPENRYFVTSKGIAFKDIDEKEAIIVCESEYKSDKSNARTMYHLARAYHKAERGDDALKYYQKACTRGYPSACNSLGIVYFQGKLVKQSNKKAIEFYKKACDGKYNTTGCYNLATMYKDDTKMKNNTNEAKKYYTIACERGDNRGCTMFKDLNTTRTKLKDLNKTISK